jgi:hypothetical protein
LVFAAPTSLFAPPILLFVPPFLLFAPPLLVFVPESLVSVPHLQLSAPRLAASGLEFSARARVSHDRFTVLSSRLPCRPTERLTLRRSEPSTLFATVEFMRIFIFKVLDG